MHVPGTAQQPLRKCTLTCPTAERPSQVKPSCSAARFSESKAQASLLLTAVYWPKDKETHAAL